MKKLKLYICSMCGRMMPEDDEHMQYHKNNKYVVCDDCMNKTGYLPLIVTPIIVK